MFISYQSVRNTALASGLLFFAASVYFLTPRTPSPTLNQIEQRSNVPANLKQSRVPTSDDVRALSSTPSSASSGDAIVIPPSFPPTSAQSSSADAQKEQPSAIGATPSGPTESEKDSEDLLMVASMKIATSKSTSKQGKDVLGTKSPWKLNLYDDDQDGVWDRAKLDKNRDDIDDEKWVFKEGRWEKDEGKLVWNGSGWTSAEKKQQTPSAVSPTLPASDESSLYKSAFTVATAPAGKGKGKDVLGPSSPWKLNLYDDDNDGKWDRAKLDKNRDNVDDEKWTYKNNRWERDGKNEFWNGTIWVSK